MHEWDIHGRRRFTVQVARELCEYGGCRAIDDVDGAPLDTRNHRGRPPIEWHALSTPDAGSATMSRRTLAVLALGWLLGIVTAQVVSTLTYQQQRVVSYTTRKRLISEGWYVVHQDRGVYTLKRSRFRIH